ncbi:MAG: IS1/IS1595 family N-terminal zinc-binding domain-containing protein [Fimbriiglobus sp.]
MKCPACQVDARKFGKDRKGNQRFQCPVCKKTVTDIAANPLGTMRISIEDAVACLRMILEGVSIRATARLSGINRGTVLDLVVLVGERCEVLLEGRIKNLPVVDVQCDEIWGFVGMKEKTRLSKHPDLADVGDAYCFTAIERESKLILAWHLGTRTAEDTQFFATKLANATMGRFQVSTDGYKPYATAIPSSLPDADFAQVVKQFATKDEGRYSPGEVIGTTKTIRQGEPDEDRISTSHVERHNLTIRMQNRRMTRLTNAFSKKWDNHSYALALQFAYYNFCRVHSTLKMTPAMRAGIEDHPWTVLELIEKSSTQ